MSFKNNRICEYYSASGNHLPCFAREYVVYSSDKVATIYHVGNHTCSPRDTHKRTPDVVKSKVVKKTANKVASVKTMSNEKTKHKSKIQPHGDGFAAVSELKSYTDLQDPLLIYAVDGNERYVFKTSTAQKKIALEMDEEGDHFMHNEYCHSYGNHKRVKPLLH